MANTLKIKRGAAASIPTGQLAEPLFTSDTYDLYIGTGASNQRFQKYIASGTSSQFLKGDGSLDSTSYQTALTFSSPLVNTSGTISIPAATGSVNGYLTSTDWTTFNSKEPAITAGTSLQYYRGDKTFQTLDTAAVPENGAIYFTEPRVRATVLTGLNLSGGGTIAATDSVLTAFGKVQNQISALVGSVYYAGTWNASTNTPTLASGTGTKGYYYIVTVAGSTNLDGITDWKVGDWAIFNGTAWDKVDNTDAVSSVNGFTGAVNLALDNISDVSAASPTNAQLLRFNGTSSLWENWTPTFEPALTKGNLTEATSSVLTITGGTGAVIGSGTTIQVAQASGSGSGYLSSTDWTTFNGKQAQLNGTGFVKASGTTITYDNSTYLTTSSAASTYLPLAGGTLTGALNGTTANFTSNTGNLNLGSQSDTAVYLHFGTKNATGGFGIGVRTAGTINATANFDILHGLYVDYTDNVGAYAGVTKYAIYQPDSGKNNYFGGPTTFNSAITSSLTATATAFIPTGTSVPARGMYTSATNVLDFSAASTNLLSLNYNTGLSTFNTGVRASYYRIVNVSTAEFGINTENNQGYIGTSSNHGFNIMTNNTPRLTFTNAGAASFSSTSGIGVTIQADWDRSATNNSQLYIRGNSNTNKQLRIGYDTTGNVGYIQALTSGTSTDNLLINPSGGSVGIGTSSISTTSTPHLFIKDNNISMFGGGSRDSYIGTNFYYNSAWYYRGTGGASMTQYDDDVIIFKNAASGSANGALTWSERMRITSGGTVIVKGQNDDIVQVGDSISGHNAYLQLKAGSGSNAYVNSTGSGSLILGANGAASNHLQITSGGNVLIGTTTSFSSPLVTNIGAGAAGSLNNQISMTHSGATTAYHIKTIRATSSDEPDGLAFVQNATERMRITSGGLFKVQNNGSSYENSTGGVNEINTNANDTNVVFRNTATSLTGARAGIDVFYANTAPNNTTSCFYQAADNTGTRTTRFEVRSNGGIGNYSANNVNLSDERVKKDITPLESYWDKFKSIELVKYKYKDQTHDDFNIGVIAQQLEKVAPEFVDIDGFGKTPEDGVPLKSIYEADLHHATIKVLQEAMAKIEKQQQQIEYLKSKLV
jgi:hypothetical protein